MDEDEAALLAELRAISAKSSSASRFRESDDSNDGPTALEPNESSTIRIENRKGTSRIDKFYMELNEEDETYLASKPSDKVSPSQAKTSISKQMQMKEKLSLSATEAMDPQSRISLADNSQESINNGPQHQKHMYGITSNLPTTFKGERGGVAEDADLLAELRAISTRSSSATRFSESGNQDVAVAESKFHYTPTPMETSQSNSSTRSPGLSQSTSAAPKKTTPPKNTNGTPPWKRVARVNRNSATAVEVDSGMNNDGEASNGHVTQALTSDIKSSNKSTFTGERGGAAEDAELLALLRGVSNNSGKSRFDDDNNYLDKNPSVYQVEDNTQNSISVSAGTEIKGGRDDAADFDDKPPSQRRKSGGQPPWKRSGRINVERLSPADAVVLAPSPDKNSNVVESATVDVLALEREINDNAAKEVKNSSYKGERGGAAEDAELLALLKGVSAKSAASRFDENKIDGETQNTTNPAATQVDARLVNSDTLENKPSSPSRKSAGIPPWKRAGRINVERQPKADVVVMAPSPEQAKGHVSPRSANDDCLLPERGVVDDKPRNGIKQDKPSTFVGERGGVAEDAELLALLRGVSAKSAASRFGDVGNDHEQRQYAESSAMKTDSATAAIPLDAPLKRLQDDGIEDVLNPVDIKRMENDALPPWKKASLKNGGSEKDAEIIVPPNRKLPSIEVDEKNASQPAPESAPKYGIKSEIISTFHGERGGCAEDAELLALLRGVSEKAGASRFDGQSNDFGEHSSKTSIVTSASIPSSSVTVTQHRDEQAINRKENKLENIQEASRQGTSCEREPCGIKSNKNHSFQGERGGTAEDAELLALLRGVSSKSAASRFDDDRAEQGANVSPYYKDNRDNSAMIENNEKKASFRGQSNISASSLDGNSGNKAAALPPRKQPLNSKVGQSLDEVLVTPSAMMGHTQSQPSSTHVYGVKSESCFSFKGDRGGAAEDAELLALLRGVSANSASGRFNDDEPSEFTTSLVKDTRSVISDPDLSGKHLSIKAKGRPLTPPWKSKKRVEKNLDDPVNALPEGLTGIAQSNNVDNSTQTLGIKSDVPSSFKGERGGIAEDPELLALLRGVSMNAGSSRFADSVDNSLQTTTRSSSQSIFRSQSTNDNNESLADQGIQEEGDTQLTRDELPGALVDKNWKIRSQAYSQLSRFVRDMTRGSDGSNATIESNYVMDDLDRQIASFVEDSNAGALDKAIEFVTLYSVHCRSAGDADLAAKITSSLLKKSAFSSRPKTSQLANALVVKLMEVGAKGASSVHSVVDVLLSEGLSSKNPKIAQAAASLILDAAYQFGAASLPLASITRLSPKMLSSSNAKVREIGVKIVAEICRALGSKGPLQGLINDMKKAQVGDLEAMLAKQPEPTPVQTGLRSLVDASAISREDAISVLESGTKELEARRFASRPAVDLMSNLSKTDYAGRLILSKWSEKVGALDLILECGGEKPYKLAEQSSSVNYIPLIAEMKNLLPHTHFAVVGKAMSVLAMLAEGVGEKLYPYLRPIIPTLLQLTKDKKLTRQAASCVDSFFGNILTFEHLLDQEDSLPSALDEKRQKNALARVSALEFLARCVDRRKSAGPRGSLSSHTATELAKLCVHKLDDSDASVRKAAMDALEKALKVEDEQIHRSVVHVVETLKTCNNRAYKALSIFITDDSDTVPQPTTTIAVASIPPSIRSKNERSVARSVPMPALSVKASAKQPSTQMTNEMAKSMATVSDGVLSVTLEAAFVHIETLRIPLWDAPEDDGGILAGMQASKWILRQNAIQSITAFIESGKIDESRDDVNLSTSCLMIIVKEYSRGFKETNVNIMKSIIALFIAICEYHEAKEIPVNELIARDGTEASVQKISDRKLCVLSKQLLSALCTVSAPATVLLTGAEALKSVKSPIAHEEFLSWCQTFCNDFGAATIGTGVSQLIPWLLEEFGSNNVKVKRESYALIGLMYQHLGPALKALLLSMTSQSTVKEQLQKCFDENAYDPAIKSANWAKRSIQLNRTNSSGSEGQSHLSVNLEIPKTDLIASLPKDLLSRMGSKDGKTAWKIRKEALDQVEMAIKDCGGLIDTSPAKVKPLVELLRGLRDRLSDTQINLKPVAARIIGSLLSLVDRKDQPKLGKLVYVSLINCVMNDIKRPMRDASLEALRQATSLPSLGGDGINSESLEGFVAALVGEISESSVRAAGLHEVLDLTLTFVDHLPNLEEIAVTQGQLLSQKFAAATVECLTSSKSETRASALSLLEASIVKGVVGIDTVQKACERLKPAMQRTVGPMIARFAKQTAPVLPADKENKPGIESSWTSLDASAASNFPVRAAVGDSRIKHATLRNAPQQSPEPTAAHDVSPTQHPLIHRGGSQSLRLSKCTHWPEYPEEPTGDVLVNLKKHWSPCLPAISAAAFFPPSGISKQDDARAGCEVLSAALELEGADQPSAIIDQLDAILKWLTYSLCTKETTTGLQDLLSVLSGLLKQLLYKGHELSEAEACSFLPFLFEKASVAKGRFRDVYLEILSQIQSDALLPPKKLGAVVCVAVLDSSSQSKARSLACRYILECVERVGLAGIGKKGVLVAAKALSKETIVENRLAALDLMDVVLSKMNGDIQRLVKICGPALQDKGRQLLEERTSRRDQRDGSVSMDSPGRRSSLRLQVETSSVSRREKEPASGLCDELPRLSLRGTSVGNIHKESPRYNFSQDSAHEGSLDPFSFSLSARKLALSPRMESVIPGISETNSFDTSSYTVRTEGLSVKTEGESSAAASLRARLLKFREKGKINDSGTVVDLVQDTKYVEPVRASVDVPKSSPKALFLSNMETIHKLLNKPRPIHENDPCLIACIESLKTFHACLSRQQLSTAGMTSEQLQSLRYLVIDRLDSFVEDLTRVMGFAFDCGHCDVNAGMSIPLLSICLASLMALFRDSEPASLVDEASLTFLIRESGTALLDIKLSSSSSLDETTASQMVRAINKLAVQAATGAARHTTLQSLMTLQQQLSLESIDDDDGNNFNGRLSRIVIKLFARVLKAEEVQEDPYCVENVDVDRLIRTMESLLQTCHKAEIRYGRELQEQIQICRKMVADLVCSFLESHQGNVSLHQRIRALGLNPAASLLDSVVFECETEVDLTSDPTVMKEIQIEAPPTSASPFSTSQSMGLSKDSATRTSSSKAPSPKLERAPRDPRQTHSPSHLQQTVVGSNAYKEDHVGRDQGTHVTLPDSSSVSERIRQLRSRLHATELAVHANDSPPSSSSIVSSISRQSKLSAPSPSRFSLSSDPRVPVSAISKPPGSNSQSLRDRMVAAQDTRQGSSEQTVVTTSLSRAAALRARLDAVKYQNN